jgi:hypothetical protein
LLLVDVFHPFPLLCPCSTTKGASAIVNAASFSPRDMMIWSERTREALHVRKWGSYYNTSSRVLGTPDVRTIEAAAGIGNEITTKWSMISIDQEWSVSIQPLRAHHFTTHHHDINLAQISPAKVAPSQTRRGSSRLFWFQKRINQATPWWAGLFSPTFKKTGIMTHGIFRIPGAPAAQSRRCRYDDNY